MVRRRIHYGEEDTVTEYDNMQVPYRDRISPERGIRKTVTASLVQSGRGGPRVEP
jgi:hypothetical protein